MLPAVSLCFQASYPQSLISNIFGGYLRSSVYQTGLKDSANVEPFFELHLDVQVCDRFEWSWYSFRVLCFYFVFDFETTVDTTVCGS